MTYEEFLFIQSQLLGAFGWFIRWWLIGFLVSGVFASVIVWIVSLTNNMQDKF